MAKGEESKSVTPIVKGIVIGEKRQRDEMLGISPSKKGKQAADAKKKGDMPPPEDKNKARPNRRRHQAERQPRRP